MRWFRDRSGVGCEVFSALSSFFSTALFFVLFFFCFYFCFLSFYLALCLILSHLFTLLILDVSHLFFLLFVLLNFILLFIFLLLLHYLLYTTAPFPQLIFFIFDGFILSFISSFLQCLPHFFYLPFTSLVDYYDFCISSSASYY